jgi:LPXTG-motif cell wall-anchored protein
MALDTTTFLFVLAGAVLLVGLAAWMIPKKG